MPANPLLGAPPKPNPLLSANQSAFLRGVARTTRLDPNVLGAWLRNEEPRTDQNTDPVGHGRYNFLNVGITDSRPYGAASTYWNTTPQAAGEATGKWLLGQLAIPGFGKSAASIQALARVAGAPAAAQIRAIQQSGWASGGETAMPGLYRQITGQGGVPLGPAAAAAATPVGAAPGRGASAPPLSAGQPVQPTAQPGIALGPLQALQAALQRTEAQQASINHAFSQITGSAALATPEAPDLTKLIAARQSAALLSPTLTPPDAGKTIALHGTSTKTPSTKGLSPQAAKAVRLAKQYIGIPYLYGGASPHGFDCSGLLQYVWQKNGVRIPRVADQQAQAGAPVSLDSLKPGDGLYFATEGGTHVSHAAMYIGNGEILESPHTGDHVKIAPLAGYYQQHLITARRFA